LARMIRDVYEAVQGGKVHHFSLGGAVEFSLRAALEPSTPPPSLFASPESPDALPPGCEPLRPYKALLLLPGRKEEVLEAMPPDGSAALASLLKVATPTQGLEELALALGYPLSQVYRLAAHLVYWGKARIIDAISSRNVYAISPGPKPL
jgi:hypothetical protein